jgi:predicted NAD/FAD-binding protein
MERLAIIGTGVAGMACGYFLHSKFDLTVYEKNDYIGGHTHTVMVDEDGLSIPIDTGFIVYNEVTYPNLIRLFSELSVKTKPTSMSFSVQYVPDKLEFCGSGLNGLFAQRKNLFNLRYIRMLRQINRFNQECLEVLNNDQFADYSLADYIRERHFGDDMLYRYLIPMSSAVWSTPPDLMLGFPARALIRFFYNHGFLGLNTQHPWRTVDQGSQQYREKIIALFKNRIYVNRAAVSVRRENNKVQVIDSSGQTEWYDKVIIACHADEALSLLDQPTGAEQHLLSEFRYQLNTATLHTDDYVMPKTRRAWSSWNYRMETDAGGKMTPSTIYWMNSLQGVSKKKNYFLSINDPGTVKPESVIRKIDYMHPVFSVAAMKIQPNLCELNNQGMIFFCGSYFRYGFHEDAFTSGLELSRLLTGERIWQ